MTIEQATIVLNLLGKEYITENKVKGFDCFECNGLIFKCSYRGAVEMFVKNNPEGGDFYVWIQQSLQQLVIK